MPAIFESAAQFDKTYRDLVGVEQTETWNLIWKSYTAAMDRVCNLGELPIITTYYAGLFVSLKMQALQYAAALSLRPPLDGPIVWKRQQELFAIWKGGRTDDEINAQVAREGAHNLNNLLDASSDNLHQGIDATLAAMLSDAWSAFEICVGDLWVDAVNRCPAILGENAAQQKTVPIDKLAEFGYDLRNQLGTFLVATGRYEFSSLKKSQLAYEAAFTFGAAGIADPFQPFDTLDAISHVRNVFAHRSGIVDRRSLQAVRRIPSLEGIEVGDRIALTGPIVRDCISRMVLAAIRAYTSVQGWFVGNGEDCERRIQRRARGGPI